jgi:hypothetical protein
MSLLKRARGRPSKYGRPSRALTVTLPEEVIARLSRIDADLGRAIVSVTEYRAPKRRAPIQRAELASFGAHAVILVTPVKALKRIPGVRLVPIGGGRALISLDEAGSLPQFELYLRDAIERGDVDGPERETLEAIAGILRRARQSPAVNVEERTIVVLGSKRHRRAR